MRAAKPAKVDPFAEAPGTPSASRLRRGLLGVALLATGLLLLAGCTGLFFWMMVHPFGIQSRESGKLVINVTDRRLVAHLRLEKLDHSYMPGDALKTIRSELEVAPGSTYRLSPGDYRLTVKSDDVDVFSDLVRIDNIQDLKTYDVKPGGILHIHADPERGFITVSINGVTCVQNAMQPSKRMLVVPEGTVRVKALWGNHIYGERLVELKANEERTLRASPQGIEEIAAEQANAP
jgi:hypothetical protein